MPGMRTLPLLLLAAACAASEAPRLAWSSRIPVEPPWPASQDRQQYDRAPTPVLAGGRLFVCASALDAVLALDAADGHELWRFHPESPARLPPASDGQRVFVGADDGRIYALDAADGHELWRHEPPARRLVLGNGHLISTWPVRGGPVLADGTLYAASGLYGFMGTFIWALDPATGAERWCASGDGAAWNVQQHDSPAFAGIAPQGSLVVAGDLLLVPGGRTLPAAYDRATGAQRWQRLGERVFDKGIGSSTVTVAGTVFITGGGVYSLADGQSRCPLLPGAVSADTAFGVGADAKLHAWALPPVHNPAGGTRKPWQLTERWSVGSTPPAAAVAACADGLVYGWSADGEMLALSAADGSLAWRQRLAGTPRTITAAAGRLYIGTTEGWLHCLAAQAPATPPTYERAIPAPATDGFALVLGGAEAPAGLHPVICEADPQRAAALRIRLAGQATVLTASARTAGLPPYFAERVIAGAADPADVAAALVCLRPGTGQATLGAMPTTLPPGCTTTANGVARGPLPGAGWWTHQYGDAGQTVASTDELVRGPLGLLWFGGPANDEVLPRHGHGPTPLVLDGRLFIEGRDMVRAVDIYTGRLLWQVRIEGIGTFYDNTSHQPGANEIGSNLCVVAGELLVMAPDGVRVLATATGKELRRIGAGLRWGALSAWEDLLIARLDPIQVTETGVRKPRSEDDDSAPAATVAVDAAARWGAASRVLAVFDRASGRELWRRVAEREFRHNALAVARGGIAVLDAATTWRLGGKAAPGSLLCLDARNGAERWKATAGVFGTWLAYDTAHDVVVEGGSSSRDRAPDEVGRGLCVRRGGDGSVLWRHDERYAGPPVIVGRLIYSQPTDRPAAAWDLLTGAVQPWQLERGYGCNTAIGSPHLLTYRSASAAYHDLDRPWGTTSLGGFKSGCTSNLIAAGGILNAPDFTRTCTCSYQIQASLALITDPSVEAWSMRGKPLARSAAAQPFPPGRIARVGLNLGAPGDHLDADGTPWLAWPASWKPAVEALVKADGFRREHSLRVGGELPWIAASEALGLSRLELPLGGAGKGTVRLVFRDPPQSRVRVNGVEVQVTGRITDLPGVAIPERLVVELDPPGNLAGVSAVFDP